jgi:hypothetical protein
MTQSRIAQVLDALAVLLNSAVDHMVASLAACAWLVSPETGVNHDEQDPQG